MSLGRETIDRINHFRRYEELYRPNKQVQRSIGSRTLLMVVAPAVMGKTSVMQQAAKLDSTYGRSITLSTKEPRPDDDTYRHVEHTDTSIDRLLNKILSGELVQYKFHPTEHTFYGSEAEDHPHEHNMLATLSGAVNQLQHVGFKDTAVVGLVSEPNIWRDGSTNDIPSATRNVLNACVKLKFLITTCWLEMMLLGLLTKKVSPIRPL